MEKVEKPPVALADWDITFYADFTIEPWIEFLLSNDLFIEREVRKIKALLSHAKCREIDYEDFCKNVGIAYAQGLIGQSKREIYGIAQEFAIKYSECIHKFVYKAISLLNKRGIPIFVISGAPIEPLTAFSKAIGFQVLGGLEAFINSKGVYEGKVLVNCGLVKEKERIVKRVSLKKRILLAFADSVSDIPFLTASKISILVSSSIVDPPEVKKENIYIYNPNELNDIIEELITKLDLVG